MSEENKGGPLRAFGLASTIGVEIATTTVAGFMGGRWLDNKLNTDPWLMLAGLLLGMGVGIWGIIQTLETFNRKNEGE